MRDAIENSEGGSQSGWNLDPAQHDRGSCCASGRIGTAPEVQEREPKTDITSVRGVWRPRSRIGRKNDEKKESAKPPPRPGGLMA